MNEQILKLAQATDRWCDQNYSGDEFYHLRWEEKFAELIVRECVRYFNEDYERDFDTLWREDLSRGIKQHFGVDQE